MNTNRLQFYEANPRDSELLTKTAWKSKKVWNYSDEQMDLWTDELTISESYIIKNRVFKIFNGENYVGFFSLVRYDSYLELDHLWLLPGNMRKGYGQKVFEFIKETAKEMKCLLIEVYAEPNSNGFYAKMGGKIIRKKESKIKDRFLNVYEFRV